MPKIPKQLLDNRRIAQVLLATFSDFYFEERAAIFMYCYVDMTVREIASLIERPTDYVTATLQVYAHRLAFKVDVFEQTLKEGADDKVPVKALFEYEYEMWLQGEVEV